MTRGDPGETLVPARLPATARPAWPYAVLVLLLAMAAIVSVWLVQAAGYPPCELCLKERFPYYGGVGLAALAVAFAWFDARVAARLCFAALTLLFLVSAGFGVYHAGVEWHWWAGPSGCTGAANARATSTADFLQQLQSTRVVQCDAAAIRILGLSLAGWNAVASLVIAIVAAVGARRS